MIVAGTREYGQTSIEVEQDMRSKQDYLVMKRWREATEAQGGGVYPCEMMMVPFEWGNRGQLLEDLAKAFDMKINSVSQL